MQFKNLEEYEFCNIPTFVKCFKGYKGFIPTYGIAVYDCFGITPTQATDYHGECTTGVEKDIVAFIEDNLETADIAWHTTEDISEVEKLADYGWIKTVGVSMVSNHESSIYNRIAKKGVYIIASAGNDSSKTRSRYPAHQDKCNAVSAVTMFMNKLSWPNYSNEHPKNDLSGFTNLYVEYLDESGKECIDDEFGGTSCARPFISGIHDIFQHWHWCTFNRWASYTEVNKYLLNAGHELGKSARDDEKGWGIPILPKYPLLKWWVWYLDYAVRRLGMFDIYQYGIDMDSTAKRGIIWSMASSMLGYTVSSLSNLQQSKARTALIDKGIHLYSDAIESPILKGDLLIMIARYKLKEAKDTDGDGIADIIDLDNVDWGNYEKKLAYYTTHVDVLEEQFNLPIYSAGKALFENVTYAEALAILCRGLGGYIEDYNFIDLID